MLRQHRVELEVVDASAVISIKCAHHRVELAHAQLHAHLEQPLPELVSTQLPVTVAVKPSEHLVHRPVPRPQLSHQPIQAFMHDWVVHSVHYPLHHRVHVPVLRRNRR